jgi:hypothetical protein
MAHLAIKNGAYWLEDKGQSERLTGSGLIGFIAPHWGVKREDLLQLSQVIL